MCCYVCVVLLQAGGGATKGRGLFFRYSELLRTKPLVTKAVTSCVIVLAGDVIGQCVIEGVNMVDINVKRLACMGTLGLCLVGPTLHVWYTLLSRIIPKPTAAGAGLRMVTDQFFFAPLFIPVFFGGLYLLEGRPQQLPDLLRREWWASLRMNWSIWIPAQLINFMYTPVQYQVLFANIVALLWNSYLSWSVVNNTFLLSSCPSQLLT